MRRPVVLTSIIAVLAVFCVSLTSCGPESSTAQTGAVASAAATPGASAAAKPAPKPAANQGGPCNEKTIPAYHPDYSKRGPLPGGGLTTADLWDKARALPNYLDENWGRLGLPGSGMTVQIGVICTTGDIYIKDHPTPLVHGAELLNSEPNGGPPAYPGGHLWTHPASEAIGGVPCQALIVVDVPQGWTLQETIANGVFRAACANNGAFWRMGHPDGL
jgi:hypothetical protein